MSDRAAERETESPFRCHPVFSHIEQVQNVTAPSSMFMATVSSSWDPQAVQLLVWARVFMSEASAPGRSPLHSPLVSFSWASE